MWDSGKGETFCEGNKKEQSARKISRCARNDSVGEWISAVSYKVCAGKMFFLYYHFSLRSKWSCGEWIPRASYKECVGNAFFPYRHPERSRGIFFVGGKRASVWQQGMGNTPYRRKGGTVLPVNGLVKESWEKGDEKDFSLRSKWRSAGWITNAR
jgi:hypothetical protein